MSSLARTTWLVAALTLVPAVAFAQGTLSGCAKDTSGGMLPGVEVVAANETAQAKAVTRISGCYELRGLPAGLYTVTARLAGFETSKQVALVAAGQLTPGVDFRMCTSRLADIMFVLPPGGLEGAWKTADMVARLRITATTPVVAECPVTSTVRHTAAVVEVFKGKAEDGSVTFLQEQWDGERTPYATGQELITFLVQGAGGLSRVAGPSYTLLVDGELFLPSETLPEWARGQTVSQFASVLRALR